MADELTVLRGRIERLEQEVRELRALLGRYEANGLTKLQFANQSDVWAAATHTH